MKKSNLLLVILIALTTLSCSSDDNTNDNEKTEKKLVQIKYQYLNNTQNKYVSNIVYDVNGNIVKMSNENGQITDSYSYNSLNRLVLQEYFEYINQTSSDLDFKEITTFSYDEDNRILSIQETYINYVPGSNPNESTVTHNITYSNNLITKTSDDYANTKVEYGLNDKDLITSIKVYRNNLLKSNMAFIYDANGNCISGSGPIDEGSLDSKTDNINLSVSYGSQQKAPILNTFFNYNILTWGTSFANIRELLTKQQGNNYPVEIEWYQYSDYTYKETLNNSFDSSGYIQSIMLSEIPDYPNYGTITYKWE